MTFSEQLNIYIETINCSNKELSNAAGLSEVTISRYRNGVRIPSAKSQQLEMLANGLSSLALDRHTDLQKQDILNTLIKATDTCLLTDYDTYISNLKWILLTFKISNNELAKELNYDPSYISRILSGTRRPSALKKFTSDISEYVSHKDISEDQISLLSSAIECPPEMINIKEQLAAKIENWLYTHAAPPEESANIQGFLKKMDVFDLDEYIQSIHFNDIRLASIPFHLPTARHYTGLPEMMNGEIDFIKATVLSKSMEDVIIYSDMPMEDMARNDEFPKKYMFGMAMLLKKGLHLHFIHDVNRPLKEMFLGLESNIPLYMTGQISPYYLQESQGNVFHHLLKVSGSVAFSGEAISGYHDKGRYIVTKNRDEVRYYRLRAKHLLNNALPLMQIYRSDSHIKFEKDFLNLIASENCKMIANSLPLFTISEDLLLQILEENRISDTDIALITDFRKRYLSAIEKLLLSYPLIIKVPRLTEDEFAVRNLNLSLSELFYEQDIPYSYEQYQQHLEQTGKFCACFDNCMMESDSSPTFKNISISILGSKCVIVSKNKSPVIHFIIRHPKMIQAFQSFAPPVTD